MTRPDSAVEGCGPDVGDDMRPSPPLREVGGADSGHVHRHQDVMRVAELRLSYGFDPDVTRTMPACCSHRRRYPPSTGITAPVMNRAASETRNRYTPARSPACPHRPSAV